MSVLPALRGREEEEDAAAGPCLRLDRADERLADASAPVPRVDDDRAELRGVPVVLQREADVERSQPDDSTAVEGEEERVGCADAVAPDSACHRVHGGRIAQLVEKPRDGLGVVRPRLANRDVRHAE